LLQMRVTPKNKIRAGSDYGPIESACGLQAIKLSMLKHTALLLLEMFIYLWVHLCGAGVPGCRGAGVRGGAARDGCTQCGVLCSIVRRLFGFSA
jgi:hypothetical protein